VFFYEKIKNIKYLYNIDHRPYIKDNWLIICAFIKIIGYGKLKKKNELKIVIYIGSLFIY